MTPLGNMYIHFMFFLVVLKYEFPRFTIIIQTAYLIIKSITSSRRHFT
uniref:Uncharacterized protein n=1 Tax=Anguilla anguilla TaxID=7936 RepID=A0A0E9WJ73_ANGAN